MKHTHLLIRCLVMLLLAVVVVVHPATGQTEEGLIESIRVEGMRRIEAETVLSHVELSEGDAFDSKAVRSSVKALFDTGFFKDVALDREGNTLVVRVVENPMVSEVVFEGNKAFDDEELQKMVKVKADALFNRAKAEQDLATLQQSYRVKGLFLAKVDMQIKPKEQNQVSLVYKIVEGEKSKVREVRIVGNKNLTDKQLMKDLLIHPTDWLSWYTDEDTYDRERLQYDQTQLKNKYLDEGYVRASVDSSIAELTPDKSAFIITHTVREGERFRLGKIKMVSDFDELPESELYKELVVEEGEWYSRKKMKDSIDRLTDRIGDFGYAFLKINANADVKEAEQVVDLVFAIEKGKRVYVNRVEISGNTRTLDKVIRREVTMVEGSLFSASQLKKSKNKINSLGFFEKTDVTTPTSNDPEKVDVKIDVEEKATGSFTLGAGYSSADAFVGTASVSQNNFLGRGQKLAFAFSLSSNTTDYNISFTEPYFLDKNLSAGIDLFNRKTTPTTANSYETKALGAGLRLGFAISENLYDTVSYRISNVEVNNTGTSYSRLIQAQANDSPYVQSMLSNSLTWNNVDSKMEPTTGRIHQLTTDVSGLGGDVRFVRLTTDHQYYKPITKDGDWVGHLRGKLGYSTGIFGKELPIFERFQLGGTGSIRGFKRGGLGPRTNLDEAYGGMMYEAVNAEVLFPVYGLKDKGVRGFVFLDSAILEDTDMPATVTDDASIRVSTGVGVNWNSPFGPLRVTFASPLVQGNNDKTRVFDFSMGSAF
ncbi:MAG: outer membrane protein assembly factor BamA [Magnetococcales bacterium]|nr:outer membrane protein assembly factor BamA [Magnetococcales bacterium]